MFRTGLILILLSLSPFTLATLMHGNYEGELQNNTPTIERISESNPDWWSFQASAGDNISLRVDRITSGLDPALILYYRALSGHLLYVAAGDDELPAAVRGPWGDPFIQYNANHTGTYFAKVWSFASADLPYFDYRITLNGASNPTEVPEPGSLALLAAGIIGLGIYRKKLAKTDNE